MRVLGIDEAGRGCVLGPLVVAGFCTEASPEALLAAGANDSKKLSARRREAARDKLSALGTATVHRVEATEIDAGNLNTLEEDVIVALVVAHRPDRVILDALGPVGSLKKVAARLSARWGEHGLHPEVVIEPKADANHPPCGAASIFAKTTRDGILDALRPAWGALGSGYPSDPVTRAWLAEIVRTGQPWPDFVRTRWGTIEAITQEQGSSAPR